MAALTSIALGVAAAGSIGSAVAGGVAAGEQEKEATAQQGAAIRAAQPSMQELNQIETNLQNQSRILAREQKLIEAVDPALVEAGKQAFQLLQGKEAQILGPLKRQRERQKSQLQETLRRQLGPGFETSSAGIEALTRFETETSDLLAQTQQGAALELLGVAQKTRSQAQQGEQVAQQFGAQAGTMLQNIKQRQVSAITGTAGAKVEAAGGQARAIGQGFAGLGQVGGFLAGGGLKGIGGAASKSLSATSSDDVKGLIEA